MANKKQGPVTTVPNGVKIATDWSWRFLVIAAALVVLLLAVKSVWDIVLPLLFAILFTAALRPLVVWLQSKKFPKWLAVALAELGAIAAVGALLWLAVWQITSGFGGIVDKISPLVDSIKKWLVDSPLHISDKEINAALSSIETTVTNDLQKYAADAIEVGAFFSHFIASAVIVLVITLFFLLDGPRIWTWMTNLLPKDAREPTREAGKASWFSLSSWTKAQLLVAAVNSTGITVGALFLGLPFIVPIAVIGFIGSFVPFIGAILAGVLAVGLALLYKGFAAAVIMLIIIIAVQQIEGHILQPLIMGNAVKIHPLAIIIAVLAGTLLGGIPGAVLAVPAVAFLNRFIRYIAHREWDPAPITAELHLPEDA